MGERSGRCGDGPPGDGGGGRFSPAGTGFEAPTWANATLTRGPNNGYTFKRCNITTMVFSSTGQLLSVADRNGHTTTLQYSGTKLATVTDSAGRQLSVTWTGARITAVASGGRSVSFAYNDGAGNLTDYTDVGGGVWRFTYDGHLLKTMRRPGQAGVTPPAVVTNIYDALGRVTSQTDELGRLTTLNYATVSATVSRTTVTDPDNHVTVEEYTNYVRTKLTRGVAPSASTWAFETDPYTLGITKVTDPLNRVTRASYDRHGNMTSYTDALGHGASATYNGFDEPVTVTDLDGVTTTYAYDANANPTSVSRPLLDVNRATIATQTTAFAVDTAPATAGDVTSLTDPRGKVWLQQPSTPLASRPGASTRWATPPATASTRPPGGSRRRSPPGAARPVSSPGARRRRWAAPPSCATPLAGPPR